MEHAIIALCAFLALVIVHLLLERGDLKSRLKWASQDAEHWQKEARRMGWKNPFEEIIETLNAADARLRAAAESMRRTAETQRQSTGQIKEIGRQCREADAQMAAQNVALGKAGASLVSTDEKLRASVEKLRASAEQMRAWRLSRSALPAASAVRSGAPAAAAGPQERLIEEAIRRAERELRSGSIDPSKKN